MSWTESVAVVQVLHEETDGEAIITTGVGQHQMFAAQWYPLPEPRRWVTSGRWRQCITGGCLQHLPAAAPVWWTGGWWLFQ